jgi:hypothetical protein
LAGWNSVSNLLGYPTNRKRSYSENAQSNFCEVNWSLQPSNECMYHGRSCQLAERRHPEIEQQMEKVEEQLRRLHRFPPFTIKFFTVRVSFDLKTILSELRQQVPKLTLGQRDRSLLNTGLGNRERRWLKPRIG